MKPLTNRKETRSAFKALFRNLTRGCTKTKKFVGWQGGRTRQQLYWNPDLQFWTVQKLLKPQQRYWCCFGTKDATKYRGFSITGQINSPVKGFDRTVAGAFLSDEHGRVYLAHSGKIGGGRAGIGKSAFVSFYRGKNWQTVLWPDDKETEMIVIGRVDGARLQEQIAHFVREIERIKKLAVKGKRLRERAKKQAKFRPEFSGRRKSYSIKGAIESQCDHGLIISALERELRENYGLKSANDRRDLFVVSKGRMKMLFEAKTDLSTSSIYSAIGQLMFHSTREVREPRKIFVVPDEPTPTTAKALEKLGIEVLSYEWRKAAPTFLNLGQLIRSPASVAD